MLQKIPNTKEFGLILCLVFCFFISVADTRDSLIYSVTSLRSDLNYLKIVLEKSHPSLHRYVSKQSLDSIFEHSIQDINKPMDGVSFWRITQSIIAQIGCGHTSVFPSALAKFNSDDFRLLPFFVSINQDKIFVQRYIQAPGTSGLRIKDEILSINGEDSRSVLEKLRKLVSADACRNNYRDYRLEIGDFNVLYSLSVSSSPLFELKINRGGKIVTTKMQSVVTFKSFNAEIRRTTPSEPKVSYPTDLPSTAILRIKEFGYKDHERLHKSIFDDLKQKNALNLVIDLRNNSGGRSDIVIDLMKYLVPKSFHFTRKTEGVVDFDTFISLIKSGNPDSLILSNFPHKRFSREHFGNKAFKPYPDVFNGKVFLLINGGTFSSAALLASSLKDQTNCVVIGEETGGGRVGCNGGFLIDVVLPKTSLRMELPLMWTYATLIESDQARGLIPDFYARLEILKVDDHSRPWRDAAMLKVKELIK